MKMLFFEALGHNKDFDIAKKYEANQISQIVDHISGWKRISTHNFPDYGTQKAWVREENLECEVDPNGFVSVTEQMDCPFV